MYEGERVLVEGVDTSFFRDVESLHEFGSANKETLGQLLFRFFKRYALEFDYARDVVSVRTGKTLTKAQKGWDVIDGRVINFFCVEEAFVTSRNLGNSADKISVDGLRQEFMRALWILARKGDLDALCEPYVKPMSIIPPPPEVYFDYDGTEATPVGSDDMTSLDFPRKHHNRSTSAPGNKQFDAHQWATYGNFNRLNARFSENMNHNLAYGQIYAGYQAPAGMASYAQYWEQQRLLAQSQATKTKEFYQPVMYAMPFDETRKDEKDPVYPPLPMPYFPGYVYYDEHGVPLAYPTVDPLSAQMNKLELEDLESEDEPKRRRKSKPDKPSLADDVENTSQSGTVLMSHDDSSSNRGASSTPSPGMRPTERLEDDGHSVSSGTAQGDAEDKPSWSAIAQKTPQASPLKTSDKGTLVWSNRPQRQANPAKEAVVQSVQTADLFAGDDSKKGKKKKSKNRFEKKRKEEPANSVLSQAVTAMANVIKEESAPKEESWASLVARGTHGKAS